MMLKAKGKKVLNSVKSLQVFLLLLRKPLLHREVDDLTDSATTDQDNQKLDLRPVKFKMLTSLKFIKTEES